MHKEEYALCAIIEALGALLCNQSNYSCTQEPDRQKGQSHNAHCNSTFVLSEKVTLIAAESTCTFVWAAGAQICLLGQGTDRWARPRRGGWPMPRNKKATPAQRIINALGTASSSTLQQHIAAPNCSCNAISAMLINRLGPPSRESGDGMCVASPPLSPFSLSSLVSVCIFMVDKRPSPARGRRARLPNFRLPSGGLGGRRRVNNGGWKKSERAVLHNQVPWEYREREGERE